MNQKIINRILFGGGLFFDLTKWVIFIAVILILVLKFWVSIFIVDGMSMEPTLHDKELVLLQKNNSEPERGDIVVVRYPGDPDKKKYVKRVVGMPKEKVEVEEGKVYINDKELEQHYLPFDVTTDQDGLWTLNDKEYFLMGDNRSNSNDSRYFGGVEKRFFWGKAIFILYPRFHSI